VKKTLALACLTLANPAAAEVFDYKKFDPMNPAGSGYTLIWEDQFDDSSKTSYDDGNCTGPRTWWWQYTGKWGLCDGNSISASNVQYKTGISGAVDGKVIELHYDGGSSSAIQAIGLKPENGGVSTWGPGPEGGAFNPGWYIELRFKFDAYKQGWGGCSEGLWKTGCWAGMWAMPIEWRLQEAGGTPTHQWEGKIGGIWRYVENDVTEFMYMRGLPNGYGLTTAGNSMNDRYGQYWGDYYPNNGTWSNGVATINVNGAFVINENYKIQSASPSAWNGTWKCIDASPTQIKLAMPNNPGGNLTSARMLQTSYHTGDGSEYWISNAGGRNIQEIGNLIPNLEYKGQWHVMGQLWVPGNASNGNRGFIQTYMDGKPVARFNWQRDRTSGAPTLPPYYLARMDDHKYYPILQTGADWIGAVNLSSASWSSSNGGQATFTFQSDYPANLGDKVRITEVSPTGFNGEFDVVSASAGTVTVAMASNPGNYVSGGKINANNGFASYDYLKIWQRQ
jgi:hypothetical protein